MAIMPGVKVRLIPRHNDGPGMAVYNRVNLHVAVSEAASLFGYFSGVADCSHFYVAKDGTIEQYIDTKYRSRADYNGNDATISVETQGGVTDAQNEPWTTAQLNSLARIWAWARDTHGIKDKLATSSHSALDANKGLSYHRLGVPGYMVAGGVQYSKRAGKICPGDAKIAQIPAIYAAANGAAVPVSNPVTTPAPAAPAPAGPTVIAKGVPAPAFPLPSGSYFGPKSGPKASVSGFYSHRADLKRWQQRMKDRGWAIGVDGLYGDETERIARAFQKEKGLVVDGLIGPATWAAAWTADITRG